MLQPGRLAQLVERLVYTEKVGGSSPSPPTNLRAFGASVGKPTLRAKSARHQILRFRRNGFSRTGAAKAARPACKARTGA